MVDGIKGDGQKQVDMCSAIFDLQTDENAKWLEKSFGCFCVH